MEKVCFQGKGSSDFDFKAFTHFCSQSLRHMLYNMYFQYKTFGV